MDDQSKEDPLPPLNDASVANRTAFNPEKRSLMTMDMEADQAAVEAAQDAVSDALATMDSSTSTTASLASASDGASSNAAQRMRLIPPRAGDVNTGVYTRVHLRVKVYSRLGETVHCSGSSFIMGQFNPNESMTLVTTPEEYPYWSTVKPLILPRGVPHQYMYALFSGGVFSSWEPIDCDRVLIPEGREMTVVEEFGTCEKDMELVPTGEVKDRSVVYERRPTMSETPGNDEAASTAGAETGSISRSSSSHFRQLQVQSRYKRYTPANYRPDPSATVYLVCYHLPVKLWKCPVEGTWKADWNRDSLISRSEGSIADSMNVRWVGCVTHQAREDAEDLSPRDKEEISTALAEMDCIPVFIERELAMNHYQGYCKSKLWPMFHNVDILDIYSAVWDRSEIIEWKEERNNGKWWEAYQEVNTRLATCVAKLCGKKDTIWVHDYHLLLFPSIVGAYCKERNVPRPTMVFFLHVPFPTSEIFRELSHGPQLLEGVLGVDVVGFHSFDHARHFLNACKRFLGLTYQSRRGGNLGVDYKGRNVVITISHVGIETGAIREALNKPSVIEAARLLREKHAGKILIGGVDVCQRLSGIPLKMLAFEQFFSMCPSWKDKLVLVQRSQITDSRDGDQQYSSSEIRELVGRITKQYGPKVIDYEELSDNMGLDDRVALWLACDIFMVTSIREGLNLKPLEYVFAKGAAQGSQAGVVILSEFSACCCVLNGALRINPWNITEVVNSLDQALTMSDEERMGRRARDLPYITNQPAANWTKQVLSVLQEATENEAEDEEFTDMEFTDNEIVRSHIVRIGDRSDFKELNVSKVLHAYKASNRRVFLLDYGGTIIARENMSMYVKKDFTAVSGKLPSQRMMEAISTLAADPRNTVFVVSGVSRLNLTSALGHIHGLGLAAENGAIYSWADSIRAHSVEDSSEMRGTDSSIEDRHWHHHNFHFDWKGVRELVDPILKVYCTRTNGSVLRYMEQGIAWNFRSTDPEWGLLQANSLQSDLEEVLRDMPVDIVRKKGLLEIVPEGLNKGVVVREILTQDAVMHAGHPDFLFCIGDDTTDESMFKSIYDYYAERSEESVHGYKGQMKTILEQPSFPTEGSLNHVFTCTVGKKPSHAHLYVNDVEDVENLLASLSDASTFPESK